MKVSIIIPTYNSEDFIRQTIDSVLDQSYTNWECLVIDDGSIDQTVQVIKEYMLVDQRIQLIEKKENSGAADTRNRGIKEAKGQYIAFIDSDDVWHKDKLKKQLMFMQENSCSISFTNYYLVLNDMQTPFDSLQKKVCYPDILRFNYLACSTVMYDQFALGKVYMPNIRSRQDWGLWISLIKKAKYALGMNDYLMYYTVRDNSISSKKSRLIKYHWYIYREHVGFNYLKTLYYFINNLFLHFKHKKR